MLHHVQTWQAWLHQPSECSQICSVSLNTLSLPNHWKNPFAMWNGSKLFDLLFKKHGPELPWLCSAFNTLIMCVHSHSCPFKAFVFTLGFLYSPFHDNNNGSSKNCLELELNCQKETLDFPCSSVALELNWSTVSVGGEPRGEQMQRGNLSVLKSVLPKSSSLHCGALARQLASCKNALPAKICILSI